MPDPYYNAVRDSWAGIGSGLLGLRDAARERLQGLLGNPALPLVEGAGTAGLIAAGDPKAKQGALDSLAMSTGLLGDFIGPAADAYRFAMFPEERTGANYALAGLGALPFVPALGGIIAGQKSLRADLDMLDIAKEAEKSGMSKSKIFDATGWYKGKDDLWRSEIDDSQFKMNTSGPRSWEQDWPGYAGFNIETGNQFDTNLFNAYPDAKSVLLQRELQNVIPPQGAAFVPDANAIVYGKMSDDPYTRSATSHELQHWVQRKEGFAKGGNPETVRRKVSNQFLYEASPYEKARREFDSTIMQAKPYWAADYIDSLQRIRNKDNPVPTDIYRRADWYEYGDDIRQKYGPMPKRKGPERKEWINNAASYMLGKYMDEKGLLGQQAMGLLEKEGSKGVKNALRRLDRKLDKSREGTNKYNTLVSQSKSVLKEDPFTGYNRLAGEVEARNVQTRLNFSPDYRRMYRPFESEDVPENLQYLLR